MSNEIIKVPVNQQIALAENMASSNLLPQEYRKNPANLLYAIQYAESLGVHPMTAVTGISVIQGKPTASAQLIGALVRRAGHKLRVTCDGKTAKAVIIRADDPDFEFVSVWTMERAKAAGLTNKTVWKQYPEAMLKARAITEVAREGAAEALFGVIYTPEELGAEVDADGTVVGVVAEPAEVFEIDVDALQTSAEARAAWHAAKKAGVEPAALEAIAAKGKALKEAEDAEDIVEAEVIEEAPAETVEGEWFIEGDSE